MPTFRYKAASTTGDVVEGSMDAPDGEAVIRSLQAQGHIPIRAEQVAAAAGPRRPRLSLASGPVTRAEVEMMTVELATLLESGLTLDRSLAVMSELAARPPIAELVVAVRDEVRGGADLSAALAGHPRHFPRFYVSMIHAGEASGDLPGAARRLGEFLERARTLRQSLVSALLYPVILLVVACMSIAVILGVVVPRVSEMFAEAGQALPLATRIVVSAGAAVETYWWVAAVGLVAAWLGARRALASPASRLRIDGAVLGFPLVGDLVAKLEAARFARALGTLLRNGVPLVRALQIGREVVGNSRVAAAVEAMIPDVEAGQGLAGPVGQAGVFPRLTGHLVQVGEEAGELDGMLLRLADIFDVEVHETLGRVVAVIGPVVILVMGLIIAGLILSILTALLSVNELAV